MQLFPTAQAAFLAALQHELLLPVPPGQLRGPEKVPVDRHGEGWFYHFNHPPNPHHHHGALLFADGLLLPHTYQARRFRAYLHACAPQPPTLSAP